MEYEFALLSVGLISGRISGSYPSFDRLLLNSRPWLVLLIVKSVSTSFRMSPTKKDPAAGHDETLSPVASIQSVPQQPPDLFDDANSQVNFRGVSWQGAAVLVTKVQIGLGVLSLPSTFHVPRSRLLPRHLLFHYLGPDFDGGGLCMWEC